jgi:uncharacterized repeat protein (TIGR01451 family)
MGNSAMGRIITFPPPTHPGDGDIRVYPPNTSFASSTDPSRPAKLASDPVLSTAIFDCNVDDPGTGQMSTRAEELAGPLPSPGGYTPCEYAVPADGIYSIIMTPVRIGGAGGGGGLVGTPIITQNQGGTLSLWDVTVRDGAGQVHSGRLFSHRFSVSETDQPTGPGPSNALVYLYTRAGYQYRVGLFDHRGLDWELVANDRGVVDATSGERLFSSFQWASSDVTNDNTQVHFEAAAPQIKDPDRANDDKHPIFLRPPDPAVISGNGGLVDSSGFAAAPISPSTALSALSFTGAGGERGSTSHGSGGTIGFTSPSQMAGLGYTVEIDTNANGTFGDGSDFVDDSSDLASSGSNAFAWNGRDGAGAPAACGTTYRYRVRATMAEAHFTMSDVENSGGTQIERLSLPGDPALGNPFAASYNDVDPYKHTAVTNASPAAVTEGISGPGFHAWSANTGNGDFVDTWVRLPEVVSTGSLQVACVHDLSVKKTASAARVTVGDTVTYTLTAANAGPDAASDVTVSDTVPSQLDVRSASSTQGRCTVTGNKVSCAVGALGAGASAKVTVNAVATKPGLTTNSAVVAAPPPSVDPPANDTGKVTVRVVKPTLRLTKTANRASVRAGETATYTIRVTNPSKRSVRNVRVCDRLPSGLVYIFSKSKAKLTKSGYCWTAKTLGAGRTQTYRITVRALPGTSGRKVNRATAASTAIASTARATRTVRVLAARVLGGGVTG